MKNVLCPHCKEHRIHTSSVPPHVLVVMPCPACFELVALFRGKVFALNRKVIEQGPHDELVAHLAEVFAGLVEAGLFRDELTGMTEAAGDTQEKEPANTRPARAPISKEEVDRFTKIELQCIDNAAYFKKHFG